MMPTYYNYNHIHTPTLNRAKRNYSNTYTYHEKKIIAVTSNTTNKIDL